VKIIHYSIQFVMHNI